MIDGAAVDELGDLDKTLVGSKVASDGVDGKVAEEFKAHGRFHLVRGFRDVFIHETCKLVRGSPFHFHVVFQIGEDEKALHGVGDGTVGDLSVFYDDFLELPPVQRVHFRPVGTRLGDVDVEARPAVCRGMCIEFRHVHPEVAPDFLVVVVSELYGVFDHGCDGGDIDITLETEIVPAFRGPAAYVHFYNVWKVGVCLDVPFHGPVPCGLYSLASCVHEGSFRPAVVPLPGVEGLRHGFGGREAPGFCYFVGLFPNIVGLEAVKVLDGNPVLPEAAENRHRVPSAACKTFQPGLYEELPVRWDLRRRRNAVDLRPVVFFGVGDDNRFRRFPGAPCVRSEGKTEDEKEQEKNDRPWWFREFSAHENTILAL